MIFVDNISFVCLCVCICVVVLPVSLGRYYRRCYKVKLKNKIVMILFYKPATCDTTTGSPRNYVLLIFLPLCN